MFLLQMTRLAELPGHHGGGAEIAHFAHLHQIMERLERLLPGRRLIATMDLVQVDILGAKPPQALVELGQDRLTRQAASVGARSLVAMTALSRWVKSLSALPRVSSLVPCE